MTYSATECPPSAGEVVPEDEWFTWLDMEFDIAALARAIADGEVTPKDETFDAEFIEFYAKSVLALDRSKPDSKAFSLYCFIDKAHLAQIPDSKLESPVFLAYVGKNKGILNIDGTGPHYMVIDGNHRIAKAYLKGNTAVPVLLINQKQLKPFKEK